MTDNPVLRQALACARSELPVFPCQPGTKIPATPHGHLDATTDPGQIRALVRRPPGPQPRPRHRRPRPRRPGHRPARRSRERLRLPQRAPRRRAARHGLQEDRHPQRRAALLLRRLRAAHRPPSRLPRGLPRPGRLRPAPALPDRRQALPGDRLPARPRRPGLGRRRPRPRALTRAPGADPPTVAEDPAPEQRIETLTRWVAAQREGNRNNGLFWAANRALETDPAADLSPLAAAARQAGLDDPEITKTLNSARRATQARPSPGTPRPPARRSQLNDPRPAPTAATASTPANQADRPPPRRPPRRSTRTTASSAASARRTSDVRGEERDLSLQRIPPLRHAAPARRAPRAAAVQNPAENHRRPRRLVPRPGPAPDHDDPEADRDARPSAAERPATRSGGCAPKAAPTAPSRPPPASPTPPSTTSPPAADPPPRTPPGRSAR